MRAFSGFCFIVFLSFSSSVQAKPSLQEEVRSLGFPQTLEVELQGGVAEYGDQKAAEIAGLFKAALAAVRDFAPTDGTLGFFTPGASFPDRRFRLLLTDTDTVVVDGKREPVEFDSYTRAAVIGADNEPPVETLTAVLRLDKLVFRSNGGYQAYAYFKVVKSLVAQMLGFWSEHLSMPIADLIILAQSPGGPDALEMRISRRALNVFESLLTNEHVLKNRNAGVYLGSFYQSYTERLDRIRALKNENQGPFVLPFAMLWQKTTLSGMPTAVVEESDLTLYRALQLVHALKPHDLGDTLLSVADRKDRRLENKAFILTLVDSRDRVGRQRLSGIPFAADLAGFIT
jgi:hypothetical protein